MAKDIFLDDDNDLLFMNGDFAVGESEEQEIKMILQAVKNDYKQHPQLGVSLVEYIENSGRNIALKQEIKLNLRMDGKNNQFKIQDGNINFNG